ncbi:hypothetical protein BDZ97DRAFT_1804541 [Flammula alnicola]|nr:hypothetical protein BDZ97DRAFT_1804541 [Flammula alnicola]
MGRAQEHKGATATQSELEEYLETLARFEHMLSTLQSARDRKREEDEAAIQAKIEYGQQDWRAGDGDMGYAFKRG